MTDISESNYSKCNHQKKLHVFYQGKDDRLSSIQDLPHESRYLIALLSWGLINLAQDMAIRLNSDPDYLMSQSLVEASVLIHQCGESNIQDVLSEDYPWLFNLSQNILK